MKKLSVRNLSLSLVTVSMITGFIGSITFEGYISNFLMVCVILTHILLFYILSTRKLSSLFKTHNNESPKRQQKKTLDYESDNLEDLSNKELLRMEAELFRITIEQKSVPKKITKELKDVREALRIRGLEGAYD